LSLEVVNKPWPLSFVDVLLCQRSSVSTHPKFYATL